MNRSENAAVKILIVDDYPANLGVLFQFLRREGFTVFISQDGQHAIQQARLTQPDIILLDVIMPDLDGFEVCRHLKQDPETHEIPVIFLTALTETVDKLKGFEVGGVDYMTKPLQQEEVLARITIHLHLRQLQKQLQEQNDVLTQGALEITRINRKLELLHEISLAVNSTLDLRTLLTAACQQLVEKFHIDHSGVVLFDELYSYGEVVAEFPSWEAVGIHIPLEGYTSTQRMLKTAQPEMIYDAQHDPAMENVWNIMQSLHIQSLLIVPLLLKGQIIGSFSLDMTTAQRQFTPSEITLTQTIASQLAMAIDNARLLEQERARNEQELETARQIQFSLLPASAPRMDDLDLAAYSEPARVVGGDFYNFFVFAPERLGVAVGDVSGKGMQAALMMALSFGILTSEVRSEMKPAELLALMSREIQPHTRRNWMNTALSYLTFTHNIGARSSCPHPLSGQDVRAPNTWCMRAANAGLIAPFVRRCNGTVECFEVGGLPLGVMTDIVYEEIHCTLHPGDLVLISSDGLIEAMNSDEEMYGFERLMDCMAAAPNHTAQAFLDALLEDVRMFTQEAEVHDDLTLVVVMMKDRE